MLSTRVNLVSRFAVVTTLLLAHGASPGLRHAHANGDVAHVHGAGATGHRAAGHEHHHHPHAAADGAEISSSCCHVHFCLFGVELMSLPTPDSDGEDSGADSTGLVASPLSIGPAVLDASDSDPDQLTPTVVFEPLVAVLAEAHRMGERFASLPTIAAPLCDTARHERSGVQLI